MKYFYIILILFFSFTIYSCSKSSDSSTSSPITELEGTWKTSCHSTDKGYRIKSLTVSGSTFTDTYEYHADSSCANDNHTWSSTYGSFSVGEGVTFNTGATGAVFTLTLSTNTLTPLNSYMVNYKNTNSFCGDSDWALNTAKSVLGKTCGGTAYWSANTAAYGLYRLDGGTQLFWSVGTSSPNSVNTATSDNFTKQ